MDTNPYPALSVRRARVCYRILKQHGYNIKYPDIVNRTPNELAEQLEVIKASQIALESLIIKHCFTEYKGNKQ